MADPDQMEIRHERLETDVIMHQDIKENIHQGRSQTREPRYPTFKRFTGFNKQSLFHDQGQEQMNGRNRRISWRLLN